MKKKLLFASTLIASQLFAESINFNMIDKNPQRVAPNTNNQILSFNGAIKKSIKSIVNISTKRHVNASTENLPLQMLKDPFFKK